MTDITELAQSLKAAAEKAGVEQWVNNRGEVNTADYEVDGGTYIDHICDCEIVGTESPRAEFIALANPANVITLVEALEKAQRANEAQDDHINQQQGRIEQLEKGQQHAAKHINNWRRLAKQNIAEREKDISELEAARGRIAELESRTVKLPEAFYPDGDIDCPLVVNLDDVKEILTTTGINWEAE
ncbi:ead/Ea22-like family protein [Klebsiella grimontii]|uniref:ead/Ea22-like family protein n=1 Tax=Klebsiella grimontii TaxID=2058152 RepID=UPI0012B7B53C|nr:ead/Ea22-like family protein [Klebsiella grimontii]